MSVYCNQYLLCWTLQYKTLHLLLNQSRNCGKNHPGTGDYTFVKPQSSKLLFHEVSRHHHSAGVYCQIIQLHRLFHSKPCSYWGFSREPPPLHQFQPFLPVTQPWSILVRDLHAETAALLWTLARPAAAASAGKGQLIRKKWEIHQPKPRNLRQGNQQSCWLMILGGMMPYQLPDDHPIWVQTGQGGFVKGYRSDNCYSGKLVRTMEF